MRLLALAQSGNTVVHSVFTAAADAEGLTERGRQAIERRRERTLEAIRLATQEQMAALQQRLDRLERASYEALIEADERVRTSRRELEELRERAYQITMPDGRTARVYRDGDMVREEDGVVVDADVFRAEDIPALSPTWQELQEKERAQQEAARRHREIVEYRERLASAREETAEGNLTAGRADELDAELDAMPDAVRVRLGEPAAPRQQPDPLTPPSSAALGPVPR